MRIKICPSLSHRGDVFPGLSSSFVMQSRTTGPTVIPYIEALTVTLLGEEEGHGVSHAPLDLTRSVRNHIISSSSSLDKPDEPPRVKSNRAIHALLESRRTSSQMANTQARSSFRCPTIFRRSHLISLFPTRQGAA